MTRHDELLAEAVLREVRGLTTRQAVLRLFELGLVRKSLNFISRSLAIRQM